MDRGCSCVVGAAATAGVGSAARGVHGDGQSAVRKWARGRPAAKTQETFVASYDNTLDGKLTPADFERQQRESFERQTRLETGEQMRARVFAGPRRTPDDPFLVNG